VRCWLPRGRLQLLGVPGQHLLRGQLSLCRARAVPGQRHYAGAGGTHQRVRVRVSRRLLPRAGSGAGRLPRVRARQLLLCRQAARVSRQLLRPARRRQRAGLHLQRRAAAGARRIVITGRRVQRLRPDADMPRRDRAGFRPGCLQRQLPLRLRRGQLLPGRIVFMHRRRLPRLPAQPLVRRQRTDILRRRRGRAREQQLPQPVPLPRQLLQRPPRRVCRVSAAPRVPQRDAPPGGRVRRKPAHARHAHCFPRTGRVRKRLLPHRQD
jgi:hypothetical protein